MNILSDQSTFFIIVTVLLFMFLGIAIVMVIDHKAKIPGHFHHDPFTIAGMRRDHPGIAFLTTVILLGIILSLVFELTVAVGERFGLFVQKQPHALIKGLGEQRFTERMRHFHNVPEIDFVTMGKKSVCMHCHGDFPHSKTKSVRSLLNMHTQFIGCMTCHVDEKKLAGAELRFEWLNFSGIKVTGPAFGTGLDTQTGDLLATDDYYSKIVTFKQQADRRELLEITEDNPEAKQFIAVHEQLSEQDNEAMKAKFHGPISPKGHLCTRCHVQEEKSFLPLRKLGFSDRRIESLTNLNIVGIMQKYTEFYMPNMFGSGAAVPDSGGPANQAPDNPVEAGKSPSNTPRPWWQEDTYTVNPKDEDATK